ncbi:MAG TPA: SIR2 family protein [Candidatus Lumbricidophila sp.]|nr:SIR2 family protein [Candidatus Lumbricidophila sp.]
MKTLQQAVSDADVVFIVGSGVSAAITENAPAANWVGLIRSGADRAGQLNESLGNSWRNLVDQCINYGTSDTLIQAASMVAKELKEIGEVAYARWLAEDVGKLPIRDRSVAQALIEYPFPILTTNYDSLLESVMQRGSADWTDPAAFHKIVARDSDSIGHLHGTWSNPSSVILTSADYARFGELEAMQALERAIATLRSIVYVGFGSGLRDPNFSAIHSWHRSKFPESAVTHFRLCLRSEESELLREHSNDHVVPVVYGENFGDLAGFLRDQVPNKGALTINAAGIARDVVQEAREQLRESLTTESVLAEIGVGGVAPRDLIVAPALLPVPHASFVRDRLQPGAASNADYLDGYAEVKSHDVFVVVGDEGSGLTTAIKWLAAESSELLGGAAPLFVRFADCKSTREALPRAVAASAMLAGLIPKQSDSIPDHVLALDDFEPNKTKAAEQVIGQFALSPAIVKILGCGQGSEDEVVGRLHQLGVRPRVLYVGRMRKADITALAERLVPGRGANVAGEAMRILETEGLKRTPMTVSLLLSLLLRGGMREVTNHTGMLDAYIYLLLGADQRGAASGLSDEDLHAVLAHFAEKLVCDEKPSLSEGEAVQVIESVLVKYAWSASPTDILGLLIGCRVLRKRGTSVEFARYSYLTLFAAKRAVVDAAFKARITGDMFYYQPVATRLAALAPTSADLLDRLMELLDDELSGDVALGSAYELMPVLEVTTAPSSDATASGQGDQADDGEGIDLPESDSPGSFGLVKSAMPTPERMHRTLVLVSKVLRDLDQIERLALKRALLGRTLELWGRFITVLSADTALADLKEAIVRSLRDDQADTEHTGEWVDRFVRSIPAGVVFTGIEASLASPKLHPTLLDALEHGELTTTAESTTATLFFLLLSRPENWAARAAEVVSKCEPTWVLTHPFRALCEDAYVRGGAVDRDLLELCKSLFALNQRFASANIRSAHMSGYEQFLRNARAKSRNSAGAAG